jgi:hypothetical protein
MGSYRRRVNVRLVYGVLLQDDAMPPVALTLEVRIHSVRGHKVMLDADLAELYGVPTGALVQAVKRNPARFPSDFMFSITEQ